MGYANRNVDLVVTVTFELVFNTLYLDVIEDSFANEIDNVAGLAKSLLWCLNCEVRLK